MHMAGEKQKRIAVADAPVATMANRFSKYKPEEEKTVRKADFVEDEALKKMRAVWKAFNFTNSVAVDNAVLLDLFMLKGLEYSAKDVENFSLALAEFQDENAFRDKASVFLSTLINNGKDTDYVIRTSHLGKPLHFLGCDNTKNITIEGDVGICCGLEMNSGSITVNGNTGDYCGSHMQGGSITVEGDAGDFCGFDMQGGTITVKGDAGGWCGDGMKGGEIHVEGEIGNISSESEHGKIFHKGKLIVDK
jgi:hypothetical protein